MLPVLHFRKQLAEPPVAATIPEVAIRNICVPDDVAAWLQLRERATAELVPTVRPWSERDFFAEIVRGSWFGAGGTWLAVPADGTQEILGTVTLATREGANNKTAVVHWLLVDPAWRRRGIARLLISHLERAAWDDGWREVQLETHAGWTDAVAFYQSIGYAPVRERSPR